MTTRTSPLSSSPIAEPAQPRRLRPGLQVGMALLWGLAVLNVHGTAQTTDLPSSDLRVLFAGSLFNNTNTNDVKAAFKVWIEALGRKRGYALRAETDIYARREDVDKRLREKSADLIIMTALDYLTFPARESLDPVFSPSRKPDSNFDDYVLLTRKDQPWTGLDALRGKSILMFQYGGELGPLWMDVMLGESRLGPAAGFFGSQNRVTRVSAAILPVFFDKADACLVDRSGWETMKELNPQLAERLMVLLRSPAFPESVICLRRGYEGPRGDLLSGLAELHGDPNGKQILFVFKIDRLVPFRPEHLDSVRDLLDRLAQLKNGPAGARGARGPAVQSTRKRNRP